MLSSWCVLSLLQAAQAQKEGPVHVVERTTDRHLPIYCVHGILRMAPPKELVEKGSL